MPSFATVLIDEPAAAEQRLQDFGLSTDQIKSIRDAARAATEDASPLMPLNAPGTLGYIHGVEALRGEVFDGIWQIDRTLGIEAVVRQDLGIRIGYQNVERACDPVLKPMPRSAKGPGVEKMCSFPLFEHFGIELDTDADRLPREDLKDPLGDQFTTYFVMVGEDGSVEVSSPIVSNKRFSGFRERIFIDFPVDEWEEKIDPETGPVDDFDVIVSFKDNG